MIKAAAVFAHLGRGGEKGGGGRKVVLLELKNKDGRVGVKEMSGWKGYVVFWSEKFIIPAIEKQSAPSPQKKPSHIT